MHRIWAIIERDLRRFRRSPTLVVVSIVMPLVQLLVLGYAFGGKIKNLQIGVVDEDHGVPAIQLKEMCQAIAANARTFETVAYSDRATAMRDLRNGKINGILDIPPQFSRKLLAGANPRIALIEDNTDQFSSSALEGALGGMLETYNVPPVPAAHDRQRNIVRRRSLSLRALHPISAARHDCAGDLRLGNDRWRHHLH
jgi:ABC-2 type transport system permease protein